MHQFCIIFAVFNHQLSQITSTITQIINSSQLIAYLTTFKKLFYYKGENASFFSRFGRRHLWTTLLNWYFFLKRGRARAAIPSGKSKDRWASWLCPAEFEHVWELDTRAEIAGRGCSEIGWKVANHLAWAVTGYGRHRCV